MSQFSETKLQKISWPRLYVVTKILGVFLSFCPICPKGSQKSPRDNLFGKPASEEVFPFFDAVLNECILLSADPS